VVGFELRHHPLQQPQIGGTRFCSLALDSIYGEIVDVGLYDRSRTGRPEDSLHPARQTMLTDAKLDALLSDAAAGTALVDFIIAVIDHEFDQGIFLRREAGIPCRAPCRVYRSLLMAEAVIDYPALRIALR
jgi:hypothetical protein